MSVWRDVEKAVLQRFLTAWGGTSPVFLANDTLDPPDALWCQIIVVRRPGGPGTIGRVGNRKMDRRGAAYIMLRQPPLSGTGDLSDRAEQAAAIFENCSFPPHHIRFSVVEPGEAGSIDQGRWWGVTIEALFDYEHVV